MTERDFKVKAGLVVEGDATLKGGDGAVTFPAASSIKMVDGSATALVIEEANAAYQTFHTTNSGEKIQFHKALDIDAVSDFGTNAMTNVNIDSGTIDATPINSSTIGASSAASGAFTTLAVANTATLNATGLALDSRGKANFGGAALDSTTHLQVNGTAKAGGETESTLNYAEARLYSDVANDDLAGSWNAYTGMSASVILDNAENTVAAGQGIVYTVGKGADTGSTYAAGR